MLSNATGRCLLLVPGDISGWVDPIKEARANGANLDVVNFADGTLREQLFLLICDVIGPLHLLTSFEP
jgi:hypothetical protein